MKKSTQDLLVTALKDSLKKLAVDASCLGEIYMDLPRDKCFGDLSSNVALRLSRILKQPPRQIAEKIAAQIRESLGSGFLKDYLREVKIEGAGFINFYLEDKYFYQRLQELLKGGIRVFRSNVGRTRKVLLEFVSANPTGPLSVAHARQAAVGDSLANILSFLGFRVQREYYLNDEGNQINLLGKSVELRIKELAGGEKEELAENYYQGAYIYDIAKKALSEKRMPEDLSGYAAAHIIDTITKELDDFGVRFDYWFSQKALSKSSKVRKALDFLKHKGFVYEKDGALWLKSTELGDDKDRVVVKSNGDYTYLAPDIAYHQEKYRRKFEWLINIWGPDHHGYINRLKAAVQALGYPAESLDIIIVQLASIFRDGVTLEMSTRKGRYITLQEVLDEVGVDAARFFFMMRRTSSHLDFDLDLAKKHTPENPVYYVQYAYARICSILRSSQVKIKADTDLSVLTQDEELGLIKKIMQFSQILDICHKTLDPYMLTVYLQELAECFHRFYDRHRVLGVERSLTEARLCLIYAVKEALGNGLKLLGVSTPEKM